MAAQQPRTDEPANNRRIVCCKAQGRRHLPPKSTMRSVTPGLAPKANERPETSTEATRTTDERGQAGGTAIMRWRSMEVIHGIARYEYCVLVDPRMARHGQFCPDESGRESSLSSRWRASRGLQAAVTSLFKALKWPEVGHSSPCSTP